MVVLVAFSPPLALPSGVCGTLIFSLSRLRLGGSPRRLGGRAPGGVCSGGSLSPVAGP